MKLKKDMTKNEVTITIHSVFTLNIENTTHFRFMLVPQCGQIL